METQAQIWPMAEPEIVMVDAPDLDERVQAECRKQHLLMLGLSYDDPVLIITEISPTRVHCYAAPYSQARLIPTYPQIGLAQLGAQVSLLLPDGRALWQKRSMQVSLNAGGWSISAGGGVDVGETPRAAAARELKEEVGIELDPTELICLGLIYDASIHQSRVAFAALIDHPVEVRLHAHEVTDSIWSNEPHQLPGMSQINLMAYQESLKYLGPDT